MDFWVSFQTFMLSFSDLRIAPVYVVSTIIIAGLIYVFSARKA